MVQNISTFNFFIILQSRWEWGGGVTLLRATFPPAQTLSAPRRALVPGEHCRSTKLIHRSSLISLRGWGLIDLPLRASNEGSPRPRVARAQKIIRLHPLLLFPPALAAPQLLSVRLGQPRPQCHPPPFARSSEPPEDSPPAAGVESATQRLNR